MVPLNIFYQEPDPDRWIKYDRHFRKVIRRVIRGKTRPGGMMMVALQLMQGLDQIGYPYRFNDFRYAAQHTDEPVCIIGKPQLLFNRRWKNPIVFGPGTYSHPLDCPHLFLNYPNVKKFVVHSNWMYKMFEPFYGKENIAIWPVGIDTIKWKPIIKQNSPVFNFLIYDKILWDRELNYKILLFPLIEELKARGFTYTVIKYGSYNHGSLIDKLSKSKAVIFLCEHETQGLAYQQILSVGVPILAWDQGGTWKDPSFYPHKVRFESVSSVPYWDDRCGLKFRDINDFKQQLPLFVEKLDNRVFIPRDYILENLELGQQSAKFAEIVQGVRSDIKSKSS